jgi:hypothetical protein
MAAVGVQGQPLLGQVGVSRHEEAALRANVGAGHKVGGVRALVVVGVHPPAQQVAVLQGRQGQPLSVEGHTLLLIHTLAVPMTPIAHLCKADQVSSTKELYMFQQHACQENS